MNDVKYRLRQIIPFDPDVNRAQGAITIYTIRLNSVFNWPLTKSHLHIATFLVKNPSEIFNRYAKFQRDSSTKMDVMHERDFARFQLCLSLPQPTLNNCQIKPLPQPTLNNCQIDHEEHISMKFYLKMELFHSRKCIWKCRLQNVVHFVSTPYLMCHAS